MRTHMGYGTEAVRGRGGSLAPRSLFVAYYGFSKYVSMVLNPSLTDLNIIGRRCRDHSIVLGLVDYVPPSGRYYQD